MDRKEFPVKGIEDLQLRIVGVRMVARLEVAWLGWVVEVGSCWIRGSKLHHLKRVVVRERMVRRKMRYHNNRDR